MSLSLFSQVAPHDLGDPVSEQARSISGKDQGGQAQIGGLFSGIRALSDTGRAWDVGGSLGNAGRHKGQVLYQRRVSRKYNALVRWCQSIIATVRSRYQRHSDVVATRLFL